MSVHYFEVVCSVFCAIHSKQGSVSEGNGVLHSAINLTCYFLQPWFTHIHQLLDC